MSRGLRFVSPLERAIYLKKSLGALRDATPADIVTIAQRTREEQFARGEVIYRPGEPVTSLHIVTEGRVRVRGGEYGDETLGAGEPVGLLSLLAGTDAGLDASAEADTVTLVMDHDDLLDAFEEHFLILHNQIRDLAAAMLRERQRIPDGTHLAPAEGLAVSGEYDLVERLLFMRRGFFAHANMQALIRLAQRTVPVEFETGATLWHHGDPSGYLYAIVDGRVRCELEDGAHFTCGRGYPLGNLESQCGAVRWYDAVTETPVVAMRSETDAFIDTLELHFDLATEFIASMAQGVIERLAEKRARAAAAVGEAVGGG